MKKYTVIPHSTILSAINKLEDFVKVTYGPAGRGILIDNSITQDVIDDGFIAIEEFQLEDELENAVIGYVKEASRKTNGRAGDGTTTSFLIMCAILREAFADLEISLEKQDFQAKVDELRKGLDVAIKYIKKSSIKISTLPELEAIALNAYRNPEMAKVVAKIVKDVGIDGIVTLEDSETMETTSSVVMGMSFDRGYVSQYMALNTNGDIQLKNIPILVTDEVINDMAVLTPIIQQLIEKGQRELLIIAETVEGTALNNITLNKIKGAFNCVVVKSPGYGEQRIGVLEDIAISVGSTLLTKNMGRPLSSITMQDLGKSEKVLVTKDNTIIINGAGTKSAIKSRAEYLKSLIPGITAFEKSKVNDRIAKLSGGIGVIRVGAATDTEARTIHRKIEDAVHATQLAYKDGVVAGVGLLLDSIKTGSPLLDIAFKRPYQVLEDNGKKYLTKDAQDATGVVVASIESAVSVASNLIVCGGIITNKIEKDEK